MFAYENGTKEDHKFYKDKAKKRRNVMSAESAIKKLLAYLYGTIEMVELDMKRIPENKKELILKKQWAESMILYVNHNI